MEPFAPYSGKLTTICDLGSTSWETPQASWGALHGGIGVSDFLCLAGEKIIGLCRDCEVGGKGPGQVCSVKSRLASRCFYCWTDGSHRTGEVSALFTMLVRWGKKGVG